MNNSSSIQQIPLLFERNVFLFLPNTFLKNEINIYTFNIDTHVEGRSTRNPTHRTKNICVSALSQRLWHFRLMLLFFYGSWIIYTNNLIMCVCTSRSIRYVYWPVFGYFSGSASALAHTKSIYRYIFAQNSFSSALPKPYNTSYAHAWGY